MRNEITRRTFNKTSAAAALGLAATTTTAARASTIVGANDRVRLGFIGVANRGGQLIDAFMKQDDMEIVALCDVDQNALARPTKRWAAAGKRAGIFGS